MSIRRMMLFTLGGFFKSIISLFKTRVLSVGSNFEAETNLENQLNTLGSNLFDSASLIITPNAYKENLLFAVKPDKVGTNLLLQTAAFTTPWIISNQLDIENYLQPFGNSPAKKFTVKSTYTTGNVAIQYTAITANLGDYTFSIFVKNINAKWILFQIDNNMSVLGYWVNIEDYTLGSIRNSNNSTFDVFSLNNFDIIDYPDGWKRIVLGFKNVSSATIKPTLFITNTNGTLNPSTSGDSVILFAPQLVTGPTVTDYISTTDRAIVNGTIGDLTVTRATTATRVNEQGLIEPVPYNLITYSEEFENSQWTKSDITIAQNSIISPNGDMTGDKLIEGTNNGLKYIISYILGSIGSIHTASVYLKANTRTWAYLTFGWDSPGDKAAYFNLIDGVVGNLEGGVTASIMSIGNGWYRCTITGTMLNNTPRLGVAPATGNGIRSYLGDGISSIYAWGAQLVNGTEPKPYQPTTNRLNVPRIDYSTGQPAILVEPQRTNLLLRSEEFENSYWGKNGTSIIPNATISPSGLMNADKLVENNLLATHQMNVFTGGTELRTNSIFVKAGERSRFILWAGASGYMFDLINLTTTPGNNASSITNTSIQDCGNGWYRCSITTNASTNNGYSISLLDNETDPRTPTPQYQGDGVSGLYIWGAQRENAPSLTSYIPTTTSSVTRNADVISNTNASTLIGQTEGTIFLEFIPKVLNSDIARIVSSNNWSNGFFIFISSGGNLQCIIRASDSYVINSTIAVNISNTPVYKVVLKYSSGNIKIFVNGFLKSTHTATYTFSSLLNSVFLDNAQWTSSNQTRGINTLALWKTQITDTQAIQLTTL